jgi:ketosteroid isomerase-like protein
MPLSAEEIRAHAEQWIAAWNQRDIEKIMEHYAEDIEFEANTVVRRWQKADGKLIGRDELRKHFEFGLSLAPSLHFELEDVFFAPSGYAVLYRRDNGNRVLDVVELDARNKACRVKAFYAGVQK